MTDIFSELDSTDNNSDPIIDANEPQEIFTELKQLLNSSHSGKVKNT